LLERGEVPGHITPDTYLRVQEAYAKSYGEMLNKLKAYKNTLRTQAPHLDAETVKRVDDTIHILEQKLKSLNAKTALQRDAILSKKAVKGPQGAFTRHEIRRALGDTIKENSNLQKAMFKVEKAAPSAESMGKYIEAKFHKEGMPKTSEEARKVLKEAGVPDDVMNEFHEKLKSRIEDGAKNGKPIEQVQKEVEKEIAKFPNLKKLWNKYWLRTPVLRAIFGVSTIPAVFKKLRALGYEDKLGEAYELRNTNTREGARQIVEIRQKMINAKISKRDRENAEKRAQQRARAA